MTVGQVKIEKKINQWLKIESIYSSIISARLIDLKIKFNYEVEKMKQDVIIEEYNEEPIMPIEEELKHGEFKSPIKQVDKQILATDEFVKMSRYINTIFAYYNIPSQLLGISLILAQRMEFKTNIVYLLKSDKVEIGNMLGLKIRTRKNGQPDTNTVDKLIAECKKYDIIRATDTRGRYVVNAFLFSTGTMVETRKLQAAFDFDSDTVTTGAKQRNRITGKAVNKLVISKRESKQVPGQQTIFDAQYLGDKQQNQKLARTRSKGKVQNAFNRIEQHDYDFESIEKSILEE